MRRFRILMYSSYFPPEYSGAALQAIALAKQLRSRGHQIEFVTQRWPGLARVDEVEGFRVTRLESGRGNKHRELRLWWNLFRFLRRRRGDFDVLHSHGAYSVAATLSGKDFVPVDFEGQYYFPSIPVLDIPYQDYLSHAPARVAASLAEFPLVVVRGHGVYACAADLNLAYKWTCSFELSAKTALLARHYAEKP